MYLYSSLEELLLSLFKELRLEAQDVVAVPQHLVVHALLQHLVALLDLDTALDIPAILVMLEEDLQPLV